jgi:hypothetical protein
MNAGFIWVTVFGRWCASKHNVPHHFNLRNHTIFHRCHVAFDTGKTLRYPRTMRLSILLLALTTLTAHAGIKWETTRKAVTYKKGTGVYRIAFPFKNTGKTTVSITDIQTGCACCTTGKVSKRELAPGESSALEMMVDVRGKAVPLSKSVIIRTSDSAEPLALITDIKTTDGKPVSVPRWNIGFRK